MVRGIRYFRCPECGHFFKAPDIEDNCTVFSMPMPCPICGTDSFPASLGQRLLRLIAGGSQGRRK